MRATHVALLVALGATPCAAVAHSGSLSLRAVHLDSKARALGGLYGSAKCPCVGLDNVKGAVTADCSGTKIVYPAEFGASCGAWEQDRHPDCELGTDRNFTRDGEVPAWCDQPWCYVDPCKCEIPDVPVVSQCLADSTWQDHPVYYSYATCGGTDAWTASKHGEACVMQKTEAECTKREKCGWDGKRCAGKEVLGVCDKKLDAAKFGAEDCKCVGIDKLDGTIEGDVGDGKKLAFPADYGATCKAWETEHYPGCQGENPPKWCDKAWCWVDPCSCGQAEPPKVSAGWIGKDVKSQGGKTLYYSYTTCGSEDLFTEKYNKEACVNQKSPAECQAMGGKCAWTGTRCLGRELAETCHASGSAAYDLNSLLRSGASAATPLAAAALLLALRA